MFLIRISKNLYIRFDELEKAKDYSKLVQKTIIDKNNHPKRVWVRINENIKTSTNKIIKFLSGEDKEHGICFDKDGKVINYKIGNEKRIYYTKRELTKMNGARLYLHNHPLGNGFSIYDLKFFIINNIKEINVCGKNNNEILNHSLQIKGKIEKDKIDFFIEEYDSISKEIYKQSQKRIDNAEITKKEASDDFYHSVMESFANKHKEFFIYERQKRT